jgi:2-deoxy-D-gluconate 3-dehydrogenase
VNPFDLKGRVAVVTGGNGGIGLGMARGLAGAGAAVAVVGRNADKNRSSAAELKTLGVETASFEADVAREDAVERLVADVRTRFGRVDVLVNNAGINIRKAPQDYSLAEWREVLDVNLTSAFLLCRAVYPLMKAQGGGKIINIGSMMSIFGASFAGPTRRQGRHRPVHSRDGERGRATASVNAVLPGWTTRPTRRARAQCPRRTTRPRSHARGAVGRRGRSVGTCVPRQPGVGLRTGTAIPVDGAYRSRV